MTSDKNLDPTLSQLHMVIIGRVQGVFFRASTIALAQGLGLLGWVRNMPDGNVELLAEGSSEKLEELLRWAHHGPSRARVDEVKVTKGEVQGGLEDFSVRR